MPPTALSLRRVREILKCDSSCRTTRDTFFFSFNITEIFSYFFLNFSVLGFITEMAYIKAFRAI